MEKREKENGADKRMQLTCTPAAALEVLAF